MKERFGVIGIGKRGKSGLEAAKVLKALGKEVFLSELGPGEKFPQEIKTLEELGIPYEVGGHSEKVFDQDVLIVCPGIKPNSPVLSEAQKRRIQVWSEIELAYRISQAPIIAITGTNGKTTTSSLVAHLAKETGKEVFLGGNIGIPLVKISLEAPPNSLIVSEIASSQLEFIHHFRPWIAVLLNFSEDHLDRYGTLENYRKAKSRITENQTESDWIVRNLDDQWSRETPSRAQSIFFSSHSSPSFGSFLKDGNIIFKDQGEVPVCHISSLPLILKANPENVLAAVACGMILGIPPERISRSLKAFPGVPHRLEEVCKIDGVLFLNDSSGTNPLSTLRAISAIDAPIILIAGGSEKNADFSPLILGLKEKVKHLILFGATKGRIAENCEKFGFHSYSVEEDDLEKVIKRARNIAKPGDAVLFSPACASFDMFQDFEHRGEVFREIVLKEREKCG